MKSHNLWKELTMHNKPPFILNCTIGYEWIFCAACQIFSIVINYRDECQHTQCLIAGFRKLLMGEKVKNLKFKFPRTFYIFGHAFDLSGALPPCQHRFWTRSGTFALNIVALLGRHKFLSSCDMNCDWLHCKFAKGSWSGRKREEEEEKMKEVKIWILLQWTKIFFFCLFHSCCSYLKLPPRHCKKNFLNEKLSKLSSFQTKAEKFLFIWRVMARVLMQPLGNLLKALKSLQEVSGWNFCPFPNKFVERTEKSFVIKEKFVREGKRTILRSTSLFSSYSNLLWEFPLSHMRMIFEKGLEKFFVGNLDVNSNLIVIEWYGNWLGSEKVEAQRKWG